MFMLKYIFGNDKEKIKDINNFIEMLVIEYSNNYNLDEIIDKYDEYTKKYSFDKKITDKMRSILFEQIYQIDSNKTVELSDNILKNIFKPSIVVVWFYNEKYYLTRLNDNNFYKFCKYRQHIIFYLIEIFDVNSKDFENHIVQKYKNLFGSLAIINELN